MVLTRPNVCAFSYHFFLLIIHLRLTGLEAAPEPCQEETNDVRSRHCEKWKGAEWRQDRVKRGRPGRSLIRDLWLSDVHLPGSWRTIAKGGWYKGPVAILLCGYSNLLTFPYKFLYVLQNWEKGGPNYCKLSDSHHLEVKYAERHTETRAYRWSQLPSLLRGFLGVFVEVLFLPQRDGLPLVEVAALDSRTCPIGARWESIAKDCEGGWARLQPDGSCKCEQCSSFIFCLFGCIWLFLVSCARLCCKDMRYNMVQAWATAYKSCNFSKPCLDFHTFCNLLKGPWDVCNRPNETRCNLNIWRIFGVPWLPSWILLKVLNLGISGIFRVYFFFA